MLDTCLAPWPSYDDGDIAAVEEILRSGQVNYWTGTQGRSFETEFAEFADSRGAVALANGTLALDLALAALGIGAGDEVIVTPRTFIASISSVVNAGAVPVFVDVDRDSGNISPATIAPALTSRTRAIIPVHLAGWPCDIEGISALAEPNNIYVVEDCAQAHGAKIGERSVGSLGIVGAWSFCQDKIISTGGEGGMVTCQNEDLRRRMWSLKDHGKDWAAVYEREHPPGFRWVHERFGTNWRMLEIQAAIGRRQLQKMPEWHSKRRAIATAYADALKDFSGLLRIPMPEEGLTHAYYRFYSYVDEAALASGWTRDRIVHEINARGIPIFQGSCSEVYLEKAFDNTGWRPETPLPTARELGHTSLMMLTHPTLSDADVAETLNVVTDVLRKARR